MVYTKFASDSNNEKLDNIVNRYFSYNHTILFDKLDELNLQIQEELLNDKKSDNFGILLSNIYFTIKKIDSNGLIGKLKGRIEDTVNYAFIQGISEMKDIDNKESMILFMNEWIKATYNKYLKIYELGNHIIHCSSKDNDISKEDVTENIKISSSGLKNTYNEVVNNNKNISVNTKLLYLLNKSVEQSLLPEEINYALETKTKCKNIDFSLIGDIIHNHNSNYSNQKHL